MNTTAKALIFAIVTVASAASIGMGLADRTAGSQTEVIHLERVVIEGHRSHPAGAQVAMQVEHLPRVVIEGRRVAPADVQVAAVKRQGKAI